MTAADCIKVVLLHHLQILFHLVRPNDKPGHRIRVMAVHSLKFNSSAIQIDDSILHTDFPDTDPVCDHFSLCFYYQRI